MLPHYCCALSWVVNGIKALTTQERAQEQYGTIDNDKIDDKEENSKTDIFKIS